MTITKTVDGLTDSDYENTSNTYTLMLQKSTDGGTTWEDYETVYVSITGDGSGSVTISPIGTGMYRIIEDTTDTAVLTRGSHSMYLTVTTDGTLTVTSDDIQNGSSLSLTYGVTNTYTDARTDPLPSTGSSGALLYIGALFMIFLGLTAFLLKRS